MAENVQWIRLKVGMFDGVSFKKIKRATIGGINYRDKLTAVWFELLDLAGKSNSNGYLVDNNEIPFESYEDIAIMLDRETEEIQLCMAFYEKEKMVEVIDNVYCLTNFIQYQNQEGLEKIREQKRLRQARWREQKKLKFIDDVDEKASTQASTHRLLSYSYSNNNSNNISIDNNKVKNDEIDKYFDKVYCIYPRKISKVQAKTTFEHKLRGMDQESAYKKAIAIYKMLEKQIAVWESENNGNGRAKEFIPHMSSWLNANVEDSENYGRRR
jgi:predicted phage replisome organizer